MSEQSSDNIRPLFSGATDALAVSMSMHPSRIGRLLPPDIDLNFLEMLNNQNYLDLLPANIELELLFNSGLYQIEGLVLPKSEHSLISTLPYLEASEADFNPELSPKKINKKERKITKLLAKTEAEFVVVDYLRGNKDAYQHLGINSGNVQELEDFSHMIYFNLLNIIADSNQWDDHRTCLTVSLLSFQLLKQENTNGDLATNLAEIAADYLETKKSLLYNSYDRLNAIS